MTPQPPKPRVLIVDDHPANRLAFETILESRYTVTVAANGRQALELTLREDYACILLDVKMPDMDGLEVAELLRKRHRTKATPIVFISAFDKTDLQLRKGYVAGATDFLFSPVDEELLKFKVANYVQIYLRHEAMWVQIRELESTLNSFHTELKRRNPADSELKEKIRALEAKVEELKRQMEPTTL